MPTVATAELRHQGVLLRLRGGRRPRKGKGMEILGEERIDAIIKKIEAEKEEEAAGTAGAMRTD